MHDKDLVTYGMALLETRGRITTMDPNGGDTCWDSWFLQPQADMVVDRLWLVFGRRLLWLSPSSRWCAAACILREARCGRDSLPFGCKVVGVDDARHYFFCPVVVDVLAARLRCRRPVWGLLVATCSH